jgi:hypothetical protein
VGEYSRLAALSGVTISGNCAFVGEGRKVGGLEPASAGLRIIDVSNPAQPRKIGSFATSGSGGPVAVSGTLAVMADGATGIVLFDISDPADPKRIGGNSTFDVNGVAIHNGNILCASYSNGLVVAELVPLLKSVLAGRDEMRVSWESLGSGRLQKASTLLNPDWRDVPGSEGTNTVMIPIGNPLEFFRIAKP